MNDGVGEPQQVIRPPNKHMLAAANIIQRLLQQLEHNQNVLLQMQHERDEMAAALIQHQESSKQNGTTQA